MWAVRWWRRPPWRLVWVLKTEPGLGFGFARPFHPNDDSARRRKSQQAKDDGVDSDGDGETARSTRRRVKVLTTPKK